jgi:hypothetical protein
MNCTRHSSASASHLRRSGVSAATVTCISEVMPATVAAFTSILQVVRAESLSTGMLSAWRDATSSTVRWRTLWILWETVGRCS